MLCTGSKRIGFRRETNLLLHEFRFNKNLKKGDDVTVVTVHGRVISGVKSRHGVLLVLARRIRPDIRVVEGLYTWVEFFPFFVRISLVCSTGAFLRL